MTVKLALRVRVQVRLVPVQAPLQPVKLEPDAGVAVKVILEPVLKLALQVAPQLIPLGLLLTLPFPEMLTPKLLVGIGAVGV